MNTHSENCSKSRRAGFTLIEMLVVIAVISILAALLFPVYARAREKSRAAVCLSNLHQLGLAYAMYATDSDESFPGAVDGTSGVGVTGGWVYMTAFGNGTVKPVFDVTKGSLYPYVKNKGIYVCPDDTEGQVSGLTYALNSCTVAQSDSIQPRPGRKIAQIPNVSATMLLAEEDATAGGSTSSTNDSLLNLAYNIPGIGIQRDGVSTRHSGGSNVLFADYHAKWYWFPPHTGYTAAKTTDVITQLQTGGNGTTCP